MTFLSALTSFASILTPFQSSAARTYINIGIEMNENFIKASRQILTIELLQTLEAGPG